MKDNDKLESGKKAVVQEGEQGELEKKINDSLQRWGGDISRASRGELLKSQRTE